MKSQLATILAGYLLLSVPLRAQVAPPPPTPPVRPADAIKKILDLSDQQVQQLTDLRTSTGQRIRDLNSQIGNLVKQRQDLLASSNPDPAAVGNLLIREQGLRKQIQEVQKSYHDSALNLLTSTQKQKVTQIQEALQLAPQAGPLAAFGLIEGPGPRMGPMGPKPGMFFEAPMPGPMMGGPGMMMRGMRRFGGLQFSPEFERQIEQQVEKAVEQALSQVPQPQ